MVLNQLAMQKTIDAASSEELRGYCQFLQTQVQDRELQLAVAFNLLEQQVQKIEQLHIALNDGEQRYRQIVETAGTVIYTIDLNGCFTYMNPSSQKVTGYRSTDLIGAPFNTLIPTEWREQVERSFRNQRLDYVLETVYELPILTRSGERKWIEQTVTLLLEDEQITGFQGIVRDITDRRRMEEALHTSEARSQAFLNAIPDLMMRVQDDGTILDLRPARDWQAKYLLSSSIGNTIQNTHPTDIADHLMLYIRQALEGNTTQVCEFSFVHEGERYEREMRATLCGLNEALVLVRDITQRKRDEEQLRTTTLRLAALIEDLQAAILVEDENRKVALINQRFCDLFQIDSPPEKLIGYDCVEGWRQQYQKFADPEMVNRRADQILAARQVVTGEEMLLKDGRVAEFDYIPIFLDNQYRGHLWQYRDITDRKLAQESLLKSEERLRRITDNMLDMVIQTNVGGFIEYASPSCWNVLGYTPESLLGRSISFWIHPDDLTRVEDAIGVIDRIEYRCLHMDGRYLWIESISNLLFDDSGSVTGIVFASRDITDRKQAEEELQKLNRLKSEFLSTAAHELRTPLTSIRGFSEILLTRQLDEARYHRFVNLINDQANQLGKIIDDLLDVSRLEAGRGLQIAVEPVNMTDLIHEVITPFIESAPNHAIQLEGIDGLPLVKGDPFRLGQVCKNLLSNAIKYSPKGGTITIRSRIMPNCLEIGIADQGLGMTPEQLAHLFEKFYRANASNTAISGTGLGLAITKLIIELHGGTIRVESEYEKGSTFYFTLPLSDEATTNGEVQ